MADTRNADGAIAGSRGGGPGSGRSSSDGVAGGGTIASGPMGSAPTAGVTTGPVVELRDVTKNYGGLRPLRVASFSVRAGERVALAGFDRFTAELFVNLLNGAVLPDTGDVRVFGEPTSAITDGSAWLESLDRFGLVTERAVLLEGSPIAHSLALPFSLEIDPMPADLRAQVVAVAREVELDEAQIDAPVSQAPPSVRMRVHLGRALAVNPRVLLMEHPTVSLPREEVAAFGALVRRIAEQRRLATIALTEDTAFADAMAETALALQPGTGQLTSTRGWRRWLGGR